MFGSTSYIRGAWGAPIDPTGPRADEIMLGRVTYDGLFFQKDTDTNSYAEPNPGNPNPNPGNADPNPGNADPAPGNPNPNPECNCDTDDPGHQPVDTYARSDGG